MVSGRILKQVRETRQFSLGEVASSANISAARLEKFEAGDLEPSYNQIQKLADVYGLPSYLLASQNVPNLPESLPDFRRPTPGPARLSPGGMRRIWASESIATFAHQLAAEIKLRPPTWKRSVPTDVPSIALAGQLREFVDDWMARRSNAFDFRGTPEQIYLGSLRLFLEAQDIIVNINDAPPDDFLGFYVNHSASFPVTFVNRRIQSRKAQLFTLVHEYAHALNKSEGVSNPFVVKNGIERRCNTFAAEFLAPMSHFRKTVESLGRTTLSDTYELVRTVSQHSLLSQHASAIRLVEGGYLSQGALQSWEATRAKNPSSEKDEEADAAGETRGAIHAKRIGELGYLPTYLAKLAVENKIVDSLDVQAGMHLVESLQESSFALATRRYIAAAS